MFSLFLLLLCVFFLPVGFVPVYNTNLIEEREETIQQKKGGKKKRYHHAHLRTHPCEHKYTIKMSYKKKKEKGNNKKKKDKAGRK